MIISYQGKDYDFDQEHVTVDEWRELKRKYSMTPRQFQDAIDEADPDASTFLYWVMMRQAGEGGQPLGDNLKPDILAINQGLSRALEVEAGRQAAEVAADPTPGGSRPDGPTPPLNDSSTRSPSSGTNTSPASAVSTGSAPGM